ncbi:hypothetical protein [Brevibacterium sp. 1718]|uniref:hypothetical protein n=1 Tax=Brevibacterium sp. 1718 TaxID=3413510 RepID=UPI003DAA32C9
MHRPILDEQALLERATEHRAVGDRFVEIGDPRELPGQISRIAGHLQDGTLDVGTSGLNISTIKNLLISNVEQFIQVIISTALILSRVILMAADFGPPLAPELKLFTYFGAWKLLAGSVIAALVLAPALRQRMAWEGPGWHAQLNAQGGMRIARRARIRL